MILISGPREEPTAVAEPTASPQATAEALASASASPTPSSTPEPTPQATLAEPLFADDLCRRRNQDHADVNGCIPIRTVDDFFGDCYTRFQTGVAPAKRRVPRSN